MFVQACQTTTLRATHFCAAYRSCVPARLLQVSEDGDPKRGRSRLGTHARPTLRNFAPANPAHKSWLHTPLSTSVIKDAHDRCALPHCQPVLVKTQREVSDSTPAICSASSQQTAPRRATPEPDWTFPCACAADRGLPCRAARSVVETSCHRSDVAPIRGQISPRGLRPWSK